MFIAFAVEDLALRMQVLDSLFLCFDKSAEQFGCTKIETVFETYLAGAVFLR